MSRLVIDKSIYIVGKYWVYRENTNISGLSRITLACPALGAEGS